jgi:hypothetical protein
MLSRLSLGPSDIVPKSCHVQEFDAMLFLLTNRTRPNLTAAEYGELAALAKQFLIHSADADSRE